MMMMIDDDGDEDDLAARFAILFDGDGRLRMPDPEEIRKKRSNAIS